MKQHLLFLIMLVFTAISYNAQIMVNKVSETITGQTDTTAPAPIIKTANSTYLVSANQKVSPTQNDFKTTLLNGNVTAVWQQLYNAGVKKAFTTATAGDAAGNIYVAGSTYINSANGQDLTLIKYSSSGVQQWVKHYNGPGSNYDVASGVIADNLGNIYLTGASIGSGLAMIDFVTIKFTANGNQLWASRYNFSNGFDIPAGLTLDNVGNVIVSGSSASSIANGNWDFATVKYSAATGAQLLEKRQANPGNAQDKLIAQTKDSNGNIYTTGTTASGNGNFNVQTIKYDANMNVVWVKTFDGHGKYDQGTDIGVDNTGNVIVTGYSTRPNLTKELLVLSYSTSGALNFKSVKQPKYNESDAEGIKVVIKNSSEIFVGANYIAANEDMAVLRFDNTGRNTLEKIYNGTADLKDRLLDMLVDGNYIVVSGTTNNGTIDQNVTIKYEYRDFTLSPANTSTLSSVLNHAKKEVILSFNKKALKMGAINNRDILFGKLGDFVEDSTCAKIDGAINNGLILFSKRYTARKIFTRQTAEDTLSLSRLGDYVSIPPFYTALVITLPDTLNESQAADTLDNLKSDINYAQLNYLSQLDFTPNDPEYNLNQSSLHATTQFPSAHINIQPAWDYSKGKRHVRLGVYDTGIDYSHIDLGSNIAFSYDYYIGGAFSLNNITDNHGTGVGGIVGAKTNNSTGISGIGGGNVAQQDSGLAIYNIQISHPPYYIGDNIIANAILEGATGTNVFYGQALHIMNNSWSRPVAYSPLLEDKIKYANANGVAFFASRGNDFASATYSPAVAAGQRVPAGLLPGSVASVGASGSDGHHHRKNSTSFNTLYSSHIGDSVDFVAPGSYATIKTTYPAFGDFPVTNGYNSFGGTSSASPHAAGVAGLIMSYRNSPAPNWDNLVHEDCEALLKLSATDLSNVQNPIYYDETPGYDTITGYGRVNAGKALDAIAYPKYRIRHIDKTHYANSFSGAYNLIEGNVVKTWVLSGGFPANGKYATDVNEAIITLNYTLNPNEQVLGAWPLHARSLGAAYYADTIPNGYDNHVEIVSYSTTQAVLKTYTYFFKYPFPGGANINAPYPTVTPKMAFSLYTYDSTAVVGIGEQEPLINYFNVYPNPGNGAFTLAFTSAAHTTANVMVYDVLGKLVYTAANQTVNGGLNRFGLNLAHLQSGLYFINLDTENNKPITRKLIISK